MNILHWIVRCDSASRQNSDSEGGKYTSASPLCTCLPPRQHCVEVALGGKQVHLGCASVYLLSSSCNFNSSTPRPSSSPTRLRLVGLELGLGVLERSQWWAPRATSAQVPLVKSKFNSASPRWTWTWLRELERSRPSSPPPAVELIPVCLFGRQFQNTPKWCIDSFFLDKYSPCA